MSCSFHSFNLFYTLFLVGLLFSKKIMKGMLIFLCINFVLSILTFNLEFLEIKKNTKS